MFSAVSAAQCSITAICSLSRETREVGDVGNAVDDQEVAGFVDEVEAVVQVGRQGLQVLAVERRDERGVDALNDRVVQFVAAVLDLVELIAQGDALLGGGGVDVRQELDGLHELAGLGCEVFKKSGPWVLFRNPMVYSVLPMVNSTIVLRVIVGHGVVRLQVQMRFCYPNGGVLSHGLTCEVCFGPNNEAWGVLWGPRNLL